MSNSKVQLRKGTRRVQAGAQQVATGIGSATQAAAQSAGQRAARQAQSAAHQAAQQAQSAAHVAAQQAQSAAQLAAQQAQQAGAGAQERLRAGTLNARAWVAPKLETAADYTTSTVAPAVSDAVVKNLAPRVSGPLRNTARQVSPDDGRSRSRLRSTLAWTSLTATILAAAGAVGTLLWRRYRAAMAADTEPDTTARGVADTGAAAPGEPGSKPAGEDDASTQVPRPASSSW